MDVLGINFDQIKGIILSHGHFDHFTGLVSVIKRIHSRKPDVIINLYTHADAFLRRWLIFPDGKKAKMPLLDELKGEEKMGIQINKNTGINLLPNDEFPCLLITGEIPREKSFEIGFPVQYAEDGDSLIHDPLVKDDQAIVIRVKNKGLVILTVCGHSGIINTIHYAKKITGINKIYSVIGGFHLPTGGIYDQAIEPTIKESKS